MGPTISVCRKGDRVYLKFMGNFNYTSSEQLLHALKKLVMSSLEFSHPGSKVSFTFKTHARVKLEKELHPGGRGMMGTGIKSQGMAPLPRQEVKDCESDSGWG